MNFISNLKIKTKINLIMAVGAVGLAILAAVFLISRQRESRAMERKDLAFETYQVVERLNENLLQARRREKDFIIRKEEKYADDHKAIMAQIREDVLLLHEKIEDEEDFQVLEELEADIDKYGAQFKLVADIYRETGLDEESGLLGSLRTSVHDLEERLKSIQNAELQVQMLMMRRHEKDFIMRLDAKYRERMVKTRAQFEQIMSKSNISASGKETISGLVESYHKDFEAMADGLMRIETEVKVLSETYSVMAPVFENFRSRLTAKYDKANKDYQDVRHTTGRVMLFIFILVLIVVSAAGFSVGRNMSQSVEGLCEEMNHLAEGDLEVDIQGVERGDEIGLMARATQTFKDNAIEVERMRREEKEREAIEREKEAEAIRLERERQQRLESYIQSFDSQVKAAMASLSQASEDMKKTADTMNEDADTSNVQSQTVASASEEAARSTQTVAAAAEELSNSIAEIARMVGHSEEISTQAVSDSHLAETRVNALSQISDQVGAIVGLIQKIAERTNLLALNASIESARAGEMGKGFAVVAEEVKVLARQTAEATEDISIQINSIKAATGEVVEVIRKVVSVIGEMSDISKTISVGIEQQSGATSEISVNIQEISTATDEVSSNIEQVAETAGRTKTTADHLLEVSSDVTSRTNALNDDINEFLKLVASV